MQAEKMERLRLAALERLESLQLAGVMQLPRRAAVERAIGDLPAVELDKPPEETEEVEHSAQPTEFVPEMKTKKSSWQSARPDSLFDEGGAVAKPKTADASLDVIQEEVAACTRCSELAGTRTQTVFGVGDPNARLCFLGEAPGADEDRTGVPFVGRGGQLLTKIIEACRLKREDVYILNMIKCRPPGNRNPLPTELTNCRRFLDRQLDLIRPEFICCLGAVAAQNLLNTTVSIGKLRGKIHSYRGAKVVCTYHPAFLLRSPAFKKETWEDMKLLMRELGVEL
jgi:DNA polymerase